MKPNKILEVCTDSLRSALIAQASGAYRTEFCAGLPEGGVTPSHGQIMMARKLLQEMKLYVLIRPRGGDFLYDEHEYETIKTDVRFCGRAGCDGVVIGILRADGTVDAERCAALVKMARRYKMGVTFHRAFDRSCDLFQALESIINLGCERILTSGGYDSAPEGAKVIRELIKQADGRIAIMPGAGVTPENAAELVRMTGLKELHGTFRSRVSDDMLYHNNKLSHPEEEYGLWLADAEKIQTIKMILAQ